MNAIERLEELERKVEAERQARREMHGIGYDDDGEEIDIDLTPPADLADCPYYRGEGTCQSGCSSEPSCITDRPEEGWPSERARLLQEARRGCPAGVSG